MLSTQINDTITKFTDAFHGNDLDRVMTFFSDDAIYEPGDGRIHRGKAQIRAAFEPQFNGAYGVMRFDERDRVIDSENKKAAFRWVCHHDISHSKPESWASLPTAGLGLARTFSGRLDDGVVGGTGGSSSPIHIIRAP